MNTTPSTSAAALGPAAVAPALLERHKAALRSYVQALTKADAVKVEAVVEAVWLEAQGAENAEFEEDPTVWLFANARRRVVGSGPRDAFASETGSSAVEEEAGQEGEEPRVVVHRTIGSLTAKQQEALRLKFQFNLNLDEIATVTGQAKSGTGGLLHHAIVRIGKALGGWKDDGSPLANDPRVTAYALDEMDASERGYFEKGIANGKALLEREKAIRQWGGHITAVLSSGAPVPKRRRRKRGAVWWKNKGLWLVVALAVGAGILWMGRQKFADQAPGPVDAVTGSSTETEPTPRLPVSVESTAAARNTTPLNPGERRAAPSGLSGELEAADRRKSEKSPTPPIGEAVRSGPGGTQNESNSRDSARPTKSDPEPGQENPGERPAVTVSSAAGTAAAKKHSAPVSTGGGDREASKEIEWVKDQLGKRKAPEVVDALPAMGGLRRQLALKQWPQRAQVRIEEMLKNVPLTPRPAIRNLVEAHLELVRSPWDGRKQIMRVSLRAKDAPAPARGPAHLVFAIDVSKSMAGASRLPLVQEGIRRLVDRLRPDDLISVVTYSATANLALAALPAARAGELRSCLAGLEAAGLTNGSAGLRLAYETARSHWIDGGLNVVLLCTDGNFNLGTTDEAALAALAAAEAKNGVRLSVFGFGRTDRNDLRLEVLATSGGGRSCYVNTEEEAERQLVGQIDGLFAPVARDVHLQVAFNRSQVADYRRLGEGLDQDTAGAAAALLPGREVTALFEITPKPAPDGTAGLGRLQLGYILPGTGERQEQAVTLAGTEQPWARTGSEFRFALAMVEFGRILREGQPAGTAELDRLEAWVRDNLADDAGGYRMELLQNLELARALVQGTPAGT